MAAAVAPARSAALAAAAAGSTNGAGVSACSSSLCGPVSVVASNMREPLLRAAIAAVSGALKDPSAPPLREVARRIKAELEAMPASMSALASARGADDDLSRQRRPAAGAATAGAAGAGGAEDGAATQDEEEARHAEQGEQHHQQEEDGGDQRTNAAAAAVAAAPSRPSYPSAHGGGAKCGGAAWQVALGTCFGTAVSFETRGFAHLRAGSTHVVVWRSRDALPKKPPSAALAAA